MDTLRRISCIVAVSLVVSLTPIRLARRPLAVPSSIAASGSLHETPTPLQGQERQGPLVILRVRALVPEKVKLSDPVQRTVRATVLTIDEESQQMKVQTVEGQQLMLYLDPASRALVCRRAMPAASCSAIDAGLLTALRARRGLLVTE